ncbi:TrkH family potassium uptake protein [Moraxella oculi]|uniref:TrkH family potassium uptake protein n=1 Tax=Moraxella oculi TaxID=2940516 RepID=A0ABW8U757_9GAMM
MNNLSSIRFLKNPPLVMLYGFVSLIFLGAVILTLPGFTHQPITWLRLLFTTTSAVTVTGLAVVDMGQFTTAGQVVLLFLMEAGGLGFMTFAVLVFRFLQRSMGIGGQLIASQAMGEVKFGEVQDIALAIIKLATLVQSLGALCLTLVWWAELGFKQAAFYGIFYAVSAFNNAGFALTSESLMPYHHQPLVLYIISVLIIIGGLGFLVVTDFFHRPVARQLKVNTKLIIGCSLGLNVLAFIILWLIERNNPATLAPMSLNEQIANAWFAAVSPRTAGFNSLDLQSFRDSSTFLTIILMFIGGGAFSTAGGIKIGTMVVLLLTAYHFMRQRASVTVFHRTIPMYLVRKSIAVTVLTMMMIIVGIFLLLLIENHLNFIDVVFEVVSAISTVGLSRGITTQLSDAGEMILMLLMLAGRLGPLTVGYLFALPKSTNAQYPETLIDVG